MIPNPFGRFASRRVNHALRRAVHIGLAVVATTALVAERGYGQTSPNPTAGSVKTKSAVIVLDTSGSMETGFPSRMARTQEAAKLFLAVLGDEYSVTVVDFNSAARAKTFPLSTADARNGAMAFIDGLRPGGETDYLAALREAGSRPSTPVLFLSDGVPGNPPAEILKFVHAAKYESFHTVGIDTHADPAAKKVLADMAAAGNGSFVDVRDSEALTKAFLGVAAHLGHYRSLAPQQNELVLPSVSGSVIAIGFDATPEFSSGGKLVSPLRSHTARLPGEITQLAVTRFDHPVAVTVRATQPRTGKSRLALIYRDDLVRAATELRGVSPAGVAPLGGTVTAVTTFTDAAGKPIDPRSTPTLTADVRVVDEKGTPVASAKATAHPTEQALVATIPLPRSGSTATVTASTSDGGFMATAPRSVILTKPVAIMATPASLSSTEKSGPFQTPLQLKLAEPVAGQVSYSATVDTPNPGVKLVKAEAEKDGLVLHWEATQAGRWRGSVTVTATGSVPFSAAMVPFDLTVGPRSLGLNREAHHEERLKAVVANCGSVRFEALKFAAKDDEAVEYAVDLTDLASGSHAIALTADAKTIRPTKSTPAPLVLTAVVGDVPPGEYTATVHVRGGPGAWKTTVRLLVEDALAADPVDFGKIEPNGVRSVIVTVKNRGRDGIEKVSITPPKFTVQGGDLEVAVPPTVDLVPAGKSTTFILKMAAGAGVSTRGEVKGTLELKRGPGAVVAVPVRATLVAVGEGGGSAVITAPDKLVLSGTAGEVVTAELRVKLAAGAGGNAVTGSAGTFTIGGKAADVDVVFKDPETPLSLTTPVPLGLRLIAPKIPGIYTGTISVRAGDAGTLSVPVTLTVK